MASPSTRNHHSYRPTNNSKTPTVKGKTMKYLKTTTTILALTLVAACQPINYVPGPGATMPQGQAMGQCKLAALNSDRGYMAMGNSYYVAGAALGNALGNAARSYATYNACMEAQGFIPVTPPT
jgi:hypothetical protein